MSLNLKDCEGIEPLLLNSKDGEPLSLNPKDSSQNYSEDKDGCNSTPVSPVSSQEAIPSSQVSSGSVGERKKWHLSSYITVPPKMRIEGKGQKRRKTQPTSENVVCIPKITCRDESELAEQTYGDQDDLEDCSELLDNEESTYFEELGRMAEKEACLVPETKLNENSDNALQETDFELPESEQQLLKPKTQLQGSSSTDNLISSGSKVHEDDSLDPEVEGFLKLTRLQTFEVCLHVLEVLLSSRYASTHEFHANL